MDSQVAQVQFDIDEVEQEDQEGDVPDVVVQEGEDLGVDPGPEVDPLPHQ